MQVRNVALIPVRGGSKSIPMKNIKKLCGKPLVYWTVKEACVCQDIDIVYVSTDSSLIKSTVLDFGFEKVRVIGRTAETATDTATTESVMLEFAEEYEFDNIVLIQATSPLLTHSDLDRGFQIFNEAGTDSVLSAVRQKRFHWEENREGYALATNYDIFHRPRRQEFDGYWVENGAFYITSKGNLQKSKNRISGNIKIVEMDETTFYEIDESKDWEIIECLMQQRKKKELERSIPQIKLFLTDCDGCLTDGGMYYSEFGDELKKFNTKDGMGFQLLKKNNILTGIVTGENVRLNRRRAQKMKLDFMIDNCKDKLSAVQALCSELGISLQNVAYVGDDINDLELIQSVGFGCCVANAIEPVKFQAKYVSTCPGGCGAVREIIEIILKNHVKKEL